MSKSNPSRILIYSSLVFSGEAGVTVDIMAGGAATPMAGGATTTVDGGLDCMVVW